MLAITIEDNLQEEILSDIELESLRTEIEDTIAHLLGHQDASVTLERVNTEIETADSMEHITIPGADGEIQLAVDYKDTPNARLEEHEGEEFPSVLAYDADLESVPSGPEQPIKLNFSEQPENEIYAIVNHTTQDAVDAFSNRSDAAEHRQELTKIAENQPGSPDYSVRPVVLDDDGLKDAEHGRVYDDRTERDLYELQQQSSDGSENKTTISPEL